MDLMTIRGSYTIGRNGNGDIVATYAQTSSDTPLEIKLHRTPSFADGGWFTDWLWADADQRVSDEIAADLTELLANFETDERISAQHRPQDYVHITDFKRLVVSLDKDAQERLATLLAGTAHRDDTTVALRILPNSKIEAVLNDVDGGQERIVPIADARVPEPAAV